MTWLWISETIRYPAGIYLVKINNRNTRTRCEICSKLTIKTPEQRQLITMNIFHKRKKLHGHFLSMGFNCLKTTKPLGGDGLLFITKFPEIPATHLIELRKMKG